MAVFSHCYKLGCHLLPMENLLNIKLTSGDTLSSRALQCFFAAMCSKDFEKGCT